jgi:hypothetical protein
MPYILLKKFSHLLSLSSASELTAFRAEDSDASLRGRTSVLTAEP